MYVDEILRKLQFYEKIISNNFQTDLIFRIAFICSSDNSN